ncbi:hypothetical protein P175DRAFT_0535988 [Aspergillus ochraceoroseus IBT 24754]|uniref:Uncharacterized protein n=1 Tax=Aspergillus ochraceoroseus IBT 24754 TaxID=1392256 RepID=A0A2T5LLM5_9EURO|nr:uncharacterized protein P175DRAFT_0535988 [Aspergillus ochraceoroseus IBT 24754]PTU17182.1 hypothetical protein P175DRAFT_0535988 [Aspergillus ochraceoroseus IBT 24754]
MASLTDLNAKGLSGNWLLDKKLSDDVGPILKLQGLGWLMRKAICAATMVVTFAEHRQEGTSDTYLTFDQTLKGIHTLSEKRVLDWTEQDHSDDVFGDVIIRSQLIGGEKGEDGKIYANATLETNLTRDPRAEADAKQHLRCGTLASAKEQDVVYLHDFIRSKSGAWTMEQIWAIELIEGKRFLARYAVVAKDSSVELRRCFYSWMEPGDSL